MTADEVQAFTANGLTIGESTCGSQQVQDITAANSNGIGVLTLLAVRDEMDITFSGNFSSTFAVLRAQADSGIQVYKGITTTTGALYLDADVDDAPDDASGLLWLEHDVSLSAKLQLTMEATTGSIENAGALTLTAGSGIIFLDSMTGSAVNRSVVFNADTGLAGDGTLTIVTGKSVVTNNSKMMLTTWDVDIDGSFSSGTAPLKVHGAKTDQTLGLGSIQDLTISDAELGRMTMGGLTVGGTDTGNIFVSGLTDNSTAHIGETKMIATKRQRQVSFVTQPSSFNKGFTVQAIAGMIVSESVTTKSSPVL
jgi:hypothetical protein